MTGCPWLELPDDLEFFAQGVVFDGGQRQKMLGLHRPFGEGTRR